MLQNYIGIDVGSVTTKMAIVNEAGELAWSKYLRTQGGPIDAIQQIFRRLYSEGFDKLSVHGVGTTGSGRHLAAIMLGADTVKNEITAHATSAKHLEPKVRTVIDIGGQDSKIIFKLLFQLLSEKTDKKEDIEKTIRFIVTLLVKNLRLQAKEALALACKS